jgi:DNA-binding PadR family transcriptional regulator
MLKGLLKIAMLKIISENKATGYQIIKKVTELTGETPSTGSIYPLLKSMQTKAWIKGTTQNGKTIYEITPTGKEVLQSHASMKDYYEQKINGSLSLIKGTFDNKNLTLTDNSTLVNPLINEVQSLIAHGIAPEKINTILLKTVNKLQKLMES